MTTGIWYDTRCLAHDNGSVLLDERARAWLDAPHPESAARIARSVEVLRGSGVADHLTCFDLPEATEDSLTSVHPPAHVERIKAACQSDSPVVVGPEARARRGSWQPALLSAGGAVAAVDWVLGEQGRNAYVLARPPGHHASAEEAMGFCLFNNVAIAARHAQRQHGVNRVAVVDWDVHHGNGTQDIFYDDGSVLYVSLHQDGLYPANTGRVDETGKGEGTGTTVNIPLPAGTGDRGYLLAFERIVGPALQAFRPELILISAGQDPAAADPLGRMSVTTEGFRNMTAHLKQIAQEICGGRLMAVQEGGYSPDHLPFCVLAIVEELAGLTATFDADPLELDVPAALRDWETAAVERILAGLAPAGLVGEV